MRYTDCGKMDMSRQLPDGSFQFDRFTSIAPAQNEDTKCSSCGRLPTPGKATAEIVPDSLRFHGNGLWAWKVTCSDCDPAALRRVTFRNRTEST